MQSLDAFKAYDIRGRVPDSLNASLAARIGVALDEQLGSGLVVTGRDVRLSCRMLQDALVHGLRCACRDAIDIGICGAEEVYFPTAHRGGAGG